MSDLIIYFVWFRRKGGAWYFENPTTNRDDAIDSMDQAKSLGHETSIHRFYPKPPESEGPSNE